MRNFTSRELQSGKSALIHMQAHAVHILTMPTNKCITNVPVAKNKIYIKINGNKKKVALRKVRTKSNSIFIVILLGEKVMVTRTYC